MKAWKGGDYMRGLLHIYANSYLIGVYANDPLSNRYGACWTSDAHIDGRVGMSDARRAAQVHAAQGSMNGGSDHREILA